MADSQELARVFKASSVDTRVRMLELLKRRALCVNALARELGVTPAAVSQHLRVLRAADIVIAEKRGYFVHYRVNEATLARWRELTDGFLRLDGQAEPVLIGGGRVASEQQDSRRGG